MTRHDHPRLVLVLGASAKVLDQARRLGFTGVLENEVQAAIVAGQIRRHGARKVGDTTGVFLRDWGLLVIVKRTVSPLSGRKCWVPIECRRLEQRRAA
jgi:hypothetical protein